jgi:predicted lysophospholipase L1 biosynthesis ABC-type transport system permease subunit
VSSGKFWTAQTATDQAGMSLEDGIAETLGVKLGDMLTFDSRRATRSPRA